MKIEKKLPCKIYGDRLVVNFLGKEFKHIIQQIIDFLERNRERIEITLFRLELRRLIQEKRFIVFIEKALGEFYQFKKIRLRDIRVDTDFRDFMSLRLAVYEELNRNYKGFMTRSERGIILNELSKKFKVPMDVLSEALSFGDLYHYKVTKKGEIDPLKFIGIANYYILSRLLSMVRKIELFVSKSCDNFGTLVKDLIYRLRKVKLYYDLEEDKDGIKLRILIPVDILDVDMSPIIGSRTPYIVLPIITSSHCHWALKGIIVENGRERKFSLRSDSPWLPYIRRPERLDNADIFDSNWERKIYKELIEIFGEKNVSREPDAIFLERNIVIPDFQVRFKGEKVFLELVGYWRAEYIEKKIEKYEKLLKTKKYKFLLLVYEEYEAAFKGHKLPFIVVNKKGELNKEEILRVVESLV